MASLLYTDIMIIIKNIFFCVAKTKVDDPLGKFWLILLGTDRLEQLFGILRTMVGNDANCDVLQIIDHSDQEAYLGLWSPPTLYTCDDPGLQTTLG
jgi:hypothetical protein